jgi:hypothetical protein
MDGGSFGIKGGATMATSLFGVHSPSSSAMTMMFGDIGEAQIADFSTEKIQVFQPRNATKQILNPTQPTFQVSQPLYYV